MPKFFNKKVVAGLVFIGVSLFFFVFSFGLDTRSRYKGIGGEFMPRVYAAVLCFCAVVQLVSGIKQYIEEMKKASDEEKAEEKKKLDSSIKNVAICFVIIIVYFGLMKVLGFILSSILFLFVLCNLLVPGYVERNKKLEISIGIFSIVLPVLCFIFFRNVIYTPLPIGLIFGGR